MWWWWRCTGRRVHNEARTLVTLFFVLCDIKRHFALLWRNEECRRCRAARHTACLQGLQRGDGYHYLTSHCDTVCGVGAHYVHFWEQRTTACCLAERIGSRHNFVSPKSHPAILDSVRWPSRWAVCMRTNCRCVAKLMRRYEVRLPGLCQRPGGRECPV